MRTSSSFPRTCSGDIYATVPTAAPGLVRVPPLLGRCHGWWTDTLRHRVTFAKPKIENLRVPALRDEDIRRFDVAVNDAFGVSRIERVGDLYAEIKDGSSAIGWPDAMLQRFAFEILHGDKSLAVFLANLMDGADVRVV